MRCCADPMKIPSATRGNDAARRYRFFPVSLRHSCAAALLAVSTCARSCALRRSLLSSAASGGPRARALRRGGAHVRCGCCTVVADGTLWTARERPRRRGHGREGVPRVAAEATSGGRAAKASALRIEGARVSAPASGCVPRAGPIPLAGAGGVAGGGAASARVCHVRHPGRAGARAGAPAQARRELARVEPGLASA